MFLHQLRKSEGSETSKDGGEARAAHDKDVPLDIVLACRNDRMLRAQSRQVAMKFSSEAFFPTKQGVFKIRVATDDDGVENVVVYKGDIQHGCDIPVRIHSECLTSEVFNSLRCDCNEQLESALKFIEDEGRGVLIYLRQEGRGIGLLNKIRAYALQDKGLDTVEANEHLGLPVDARTYGSAAEILRFFRIESIRLLTNNPAKIDAIRRLGVVVTDRISALVPPNHINHRYLETKKLKMNYLA